MTNEQYNYNVNIMCSNQLNALNTQFSQKQNILNQQFNAQTSLMTAQCNNQIAIITQSKNEQLSFIENGRIAQVNSINALRKDENERLEKKINHLVSQAEEKKKPIEDEYILNCQKAYTKKMTNLKQYPQVFVANGYSGGSGTESLYVNVEVVYQQELANYKQAYNNKIDEVNQEITEIRQAGAIEIQENNQRYDNMIINVEQQASLSKLEAERECSNMIENIKRNLQSSISEATLSYNMATQEAQMEHQYATVETINFYESMKIWY